MKVAFPLTDSKKLAIDFANSVFIGFYDESAGQMEIISLPEMKNLLQDMSFHEYLISRELGGIISPQFNFLTLRILKENQVQAFQAISDNLEENLQALADLRLKPFQPVFSGGCSSSCSKCNNNCA